MRKMWLFLFSLLILLNVQVSYADELWKGTQYGMTVKQVKKIFPNAVTPQNQDAIYSGVELLRLDDVKISNESFVAKFFFSNEKLVQVTLTLDNVSDFYQGKLIFDSLVDSLRAKYGKELSLKSSEVLTLLEANWMSNKTNISLLCLEVNETRTTININYSTRISKEGKNL